MRVVDDPVEASVIAQFGMIEQTLEWWLVERSFPTGSCSPQLVKQIGERGFVHHERIGREHIPEPVFNVSPDPLDERLSFRDAVLVIPPAIPPFADFLYSRAHRRREPGRGDRVKVEGCPAWAFRRGSGELVLDRSDKPRVIRCDDRMHAVARHFDDRSGKILAIHRIEMSSEHRPAANSPVRRPACERAPKG